MNSGCAYNDHTAHCSKQLLELGKKKYDGKKMNFTYEINLEHFTTIECICNISL